MRRLPCLALLVLLPDARADDGPAYPPPAEVRASFKKLLDRLVVPLDPKVTDRRVEKAVTVEELTFASEKKTDGKVERVPVLMVVPEKAKALPAIIVLHGTGGRKEQVRDWLDAFAARGVVGVAIDARYHGARVPGGAVGAAAYNDAIARAWRSGPGQPQEHPFYYDTCWDLWRTVDYLRTRPEIDPERIGMLGISMGGIQTWLAASADERVKVAVPLIAAQSFRWSLDNGKWHARANTIKAAHEAAAKDLGAAEVDARVCKALWDKVIPGMLDRYDCPSMVRLCAPRPLLLLNGADDPNCPVEGAKLAVASAEKAYRDAGAAERFKAVIAPGVKHQVTAELRKEAVDWCVRWLSR